MTKSLDYVKEYFSNLERQVRVLQEQVRDLQYAVARLTKYMKEEEE